MMFSADVYTRLAVDLTQLQVGDIINIHSVTTHRYVQVLQTRDHLYLETTGAPADPIPPLTAAEIGVLQEAGWQPPEPPNKFGWHQTFPWPLTSAAATTAANHFIEIIQRSILPGGPASISIQAWNDDNGDDLHLRSVDLLRETTEN